MDVTIRTPDGKNRKYEYDGSKDPQENKGNLTSNSGTSTRPINMEESDTQVEERVPESPIDWEPIK
ncbi:hypothetical protein TSUD_162600 [Trifolium subterraneum]|uniref:Uncharacterized protein n=1 Tax=Trifolium subterraneum TaxID=3900 RepID=A0A2Z6MT90_TRISU|nr:hypothetical protein TSUD_162600 [Trifolium subterraneum]